MPATLVELRDGERVPYPNQNWNSPSGDADAGAFVSLQAIVVDAFDRLWAMDTGAPKFQPTLPGGPKLVCIDLATDQVVQTITFPADVALPTSYLNDVRFDLSRGSAGAAFSTDSSAVGPNGIVVIDLATGESWRRLHDHPSTKALPQHDFWPIVEGNPFPTPVTIGSDGIAISADGKQLYYCPLASRRLWSVSVDALVDRPLSDDDVAETVVDEGDKGTGSDGLETDDAGNIYLTSYEHNALLRRTPDGRFETVAQDPRLLWPDTLSAAPDGYLYLTANQVHRHPFFSGGIDRPLKPHCWPSSPATVTASPTSPIGD
jgi:sugar lactone lactonase YvrE